jgi:hypothetical protein
VYSTRQARADIDAVYSMGLFDDVNILPQPAEDSTLENPKARPVPRPPPALFQAPLGGGLSGVVAWGVRMAGGSRTSSRQRRPQPQHCACTQSAPQCCVRGSKSAGGPGAWASQCLGM